VILADQGDDTTPAANLQWRAVAMQSFRIEIRAKCVMTPRG